MSPEPRPFPWGEVLHLALAVLRWPPEAVWRATPREIALALGPARGGAPPLDRAGLDALMRRYPDA